METRTNRVRRQPITVSLYPDMVAELETAGHETDRTMSDITREALRQWLDSRKPRNRRAKSA